MQILYQSTKKDKSDKTILYEYFHDKLFPSQCGFRKGYNSQPNVLVLTEKFKESIDKGNIFGALLTDLSKAFACIDHTLLIAKLCVLGISPLLLKLLYFYRIKLSESESIKSLVIELIFNLVYLRALF